MSTKCAPLLLIAATLSTVLATAPASAACRDRDRPWLRDARGETVSETAIRVSFRTNAGYWDYTVKEGSATGKPIDQASGARAVAGPDRIVRRIFNGLKPNTKYCVEMFARTEAGKEGCTTLFASQVCPTTAANPCDAYAKTAVDTVNLVRNVYKCDPKLISGPRWSTSLDEHMKWCQQVSPAARKAETEARTKTMHECRVARRKVTPTLAVIWQAGNVFKVVGRGFLPNSPIAIDVSGPPTTPHTITVASGSRIVTNAIGNFALTLSDVCTSALNRGAVAFTARDQDGNQAKTTAACQGSVDYTPNRKIKP